MPHVLSKKVTTDGRSKLFSLLQPAAEARKHFSVLAGALNQKSAKAALAVVKGMAGMYQGGLFTGLLFGSLLLGPFIAALQFNIGYGAPLVTALILMVAGFVSLSIDGAVKGRKYSTRWLFALWGLMALTLMVIGGRCPAWQLLGTVVGMTIVALLGLSLSLVTVFGLFARGLLKALHGNNYGLCSGKTQNEAPTLSTCAHTQIQTTAPAPAWLRASAACQACGFTANLIQLRADIAYQAASRL